LNTFARNSSHPHSLHLTSPATELAALPVAVKLGLLPLDTGGGGAFFFPGTGLPLLLTLLPAIPGLVVPTVAGLLKLNPATCSSKLSSLLSELGLGGFNVVVRLTLGTLPDDSVAGITTQYVAGNIP
jgi:hypothetical protein